MFDAVVERGVAAAVVNVKQVGQNAGEHLARSGGGKVPILEALVLAAEYFLAITTCQHPALVERIEKDTAVTREEMAGKIYSLDRGTGALSDQHVDQGETDRDALARIEHAGQERITFVVVVLRVPRENELIAEEIGHNVHTVTVTGSAAHTAFELRTPTIKALTVGRGFETPEQSRAEQPAGLFEIGPVSEDRAEKLEALEGFVLHDFVEDIAGMQGGQRVVAIGEIAQVVEDGRAVGSKLLFDQLHCLLVVVGEQAHEGVFLRVHDCFYSALKQFTRQWQAAPGWRLVMSARLRDVDVP